MLEEIGCGRKEVLLLLNKCDVIHNGGLFESLQTVYPEAVCISARTGLNLDRLAQAVAQKVKGQDVHVRLQSRIEDGKLISFLRAHALDLQEQYDGRYVTLEAWLGKNQLPQLKRLGAEQIEIL